MFSFIHPSIQLYIKLRMDRGIPSFNRIVIDKIQNQNMQTHYQKLYQIHHSKRSKGIISCSTKANPKKQQIMEEKNTEIDKNNVILFQKMNKIMKRTDPFNSGNNHHKITSRNFANHIQRVNEENQQFLERLCKMKPTIDNKKILQERKRQLTILKFLNRNSYHGKGDKNRSDSIHLSHISQKKSTQRERDKEQSVFKMSRTRNNLEKTSSLVKFSSSFMLPLNPRPRYTEGDAHDEESNELKESQAYFKREMQKLEERRRKAQSALSQTDSLIPKPEQHSARPMVAKQSIFSNKSITLFATFKRVEDRLYKVEIHRRHKFYEVVCFELDSVDSKIVLRLSELTGNELLSAIDYDYQLVVDSLIIDGESITIDRSKLEYHRSHDDQSAIQPESFKMRLKIQTNKNPSHITEQANEHQSSIHLSDNQDV